ncbi:MAG: ECF RNA polymerase sigma factor ShbA [Thermoanaerobaculia bacterium]|nr:ECF RNA polymerase sigma factor ShbA [Thermoanaerobaculia bacterium]
MAHRYTSLPKGRPRYAFGALQQEEVGGDTSDGALARRVAEGNTAAESELYRRLAPRVRLYGLRHLRDAAAADDLVQDVLLMAFETLRDGGVRDPERFTSFVLGSCRRFVADLRRGTARRRGLLERFGSVLAPPPPAEEAPMDLDHLARCLEGLPERDRSVIVLTFYAEAASEEIGSELGLKPGNVRVVRHRALARLRACLEAEP